MRVLEQEYKRRHLQPHSLFLWVPISGMTNGEQNFVAKATLSFRLSQAVINQG